MDRLFVYGSLRTGQAARSLIANHVVESQPASADGRMFALRGGGSAPSARFAGAWSASS